jgi:cytochrome c biogenesis protein CcdA
MLQGQITMEIVSTASLITAFLAGIAALFAPCCVGVLLPSYLASVFKTKTKILLMTFIYYLGLLTVFLPLGLGMAGLGTLFSSYHAVFFTLGGLFMLTLGLFLVSGKSFMLPMRVKPSLKNHDFGSLYVLGIFSGIATSCCAPVLAGVLALSALPGSWLLGTLYALVFVTGLVLPLFLAALCIDRTNIANRLTSLRRRVGYTLLGHRVSVNLSHLISGILFIMIGLFILLFERVNPDAGSLYLLKINLFTAQITQGVARLTHAVPQWVWAGLFLAIVALIARAAWKQANDNSKGV